MRRVLLRLSSCLLLFALVACDTAEDDPAFSTTVAITTPSGEPVANASVAARPCLVVLGEPVCDAEQLVRQADPSWRVEAVELVSFTADFDSALDAVVLAWTTASETNNAGFEIQQRAGSSDSFQQIGFVEGAGTTSETRSYRYVVSNLDGGTYDFRLRQVDTDDTGTLSEPRTVSVPGQVGPPSAFAFQGPYPHPIGAVGTFQFALPEAGDVRLTVERLDGTVVDEVVNATVEAGRQQLNWSPTADDASVPDGVYRTRLTVARDGETVQDTTVQTVVFREPARPRTLGETNADGQLQIADRAAFPGLFDVGESPIRNSTGLQVGIMTPSRRVVFTITDPATGTMQTVERTIEEGSNRVEVTVE